MNKMLKISTMAALLGVAGAAYADPAETKGGLKIKTEDGRFEFGLNGRIHLDGYVLMEDHDAGSRSGGATGNSATQSGVEFRRTRLTLAGKAYGWEYKFECNFTSAGQACYRDLFIATKVGPGKLTIGHFKPYRGMEELTSSNELTMMERPFASASGVFTNRQFGTGLGYLVGGGMYTAAAYLQNQYNHNLTVRNEGWQAGGRVTVAPVTSDQFTMHMGLSGGMENATNQAAVLPLVGSTANYGGRRGATMALGAAGAANAAAPNVNKNNHVMHAGLELAAAAGPVFFQAEAMQLTLNDAQTSLHAIREDMDIFAGYVMASVFLTGESKPYKKATGVFGSPKPNGSMGAFELTARYDVAEADVLPTAVLASRNDDATAITLGLNWYVNPNVRFMLNYVMGSGDNALAADPAFQDDPTNLMARAQFSF